MNKDSAIQEIEAAGLKKKNGSRIQQSIVSTIF